MTFGKPFELRVDGVLVAKFRTYEQAQWSPLIATHKARYSIDKRIGSRLFNQAFGYRAGTTSTADLAAMGVPIHPNCISDEKMR